MNAELNAQPPADYTLRDYLKVLFRQKAVVFVTVLTVCAATYVGLLLKTPVYEAQVKMLISAQKEVASPYYRDILTGQHVEEALTQSEVVTSGPVLERTAGALNLFKRPLDYEKKFASVLKQNVIDWQIKRLRLDRFSPNEQQAIQYRLILDDLKQHIKVEPVRDTNVFLIKVRDYSPIAAAIIANTLSRSYVMFDMEQQLVELEARFTEENALVVQMKTNIAKMEKNLNGQPLPSVEAIGPASVKIIEQSTPPMRPFGLPKWALGALALVMSLFLAVMLAFVFDYMDPAFKSPDEAERFLGVPVLGFVPKRRRGDKALAGHSKNSSAYAKYNERLADQLYMLKKNKHAKVVLFSSTQFHEGASTVAANLAYYLGQKTKQRTLLIDAILRHPSIHTLYKIEQGPGLAEILEGKVPHEKGVRKIDENLSVVPAGVSTLNPITLIDSPAMAELLKKAAEKYDAVLVDCANFQSYRDAAVLLPLVDGLVIVIKEGQTRRQAVQSALSVFDRSKVLGLVLNHRQFPIPKWIYETV